MHSCSDTNNDPNLLMLSDFSEEMMMVLYWGKDSWQDCCYCQKSPLHPPQYQSHLMNLQQRVIANK